MKKLSIFILLIMCFIGFGCVRSQKLIASMPFDEEKAQSLMATGDNIIKGNAFLKTRGGDVKTSAGEEALLLPDIPYNFIIIQQIYGSTQKGYRDWHSRHIDTQSLDHRFRQYAKSAICDAQGNFEFTNISDGDFFILTRVIWEAPTYGMQGGELMLHVSVSGGETKNIIMTER